MMKRLCLLAIALCAFCSSSWAQSKFVTDTIYSEILNSPRAYTVYLPASFDKNPQKQYPVLYLLHGLYGKNTDWQDMSQLKLIADKLTWNGTIDEMIIVTPDAHQGLPDSQPGYFNIPGWRYEDFFFQEFMPQIEKKYRVIADKRHRAIAGLSMGGGGTTVYSQHHPEMFAAAYPMSALMSIPPDRLKPGPKSFDEKLTNSCIENDCVQFVLNADEATKEALRTVDWYIDCGDDDFLLDCNLAMYQAMRDNKIPAQLRVRDGVHNWEYWSSALYDCLPFVNRSFKK